MSKYRIIKMCNMSPIHIGTGKDNYDSSAGELHSDTLSAALAAIRAQQGKNSDVEEFLESFALSSAFPFWQDTCFLPKMQGLLDVKMTDAEEHRVRKQLKQVRHIESSLWGRIAKGESLPLSEIKLNGQFMTAPGTSTGKIYVSEVRDRVTVPRLENADATPFSFEWRYFNPQGGLYCIVDTKGDDGLFDEIARLFKVLGLTGIGSDKSVGGGLFDVEIGEIELPQVADSNAVMLLSSYIPADEAELKSLNLIDSRYVLMKRGGYIAGSRHEQLRHLRKNSIYMFGAGSVFRCNGITLTGKVENLRPSWNDDAMHAVNRSGRPFCLNVKLSNKN